MAPKKGSRPQGSGQKNKSTPSNAAVPGSEHVVFGRDDGKTKKVEEQVLAPPRINVKKEIGGNSWTGKLPVDLLSELCQKQKWNKPHYSPRKMPEAQGGLYRDVITLSMNNPKTRDTTRVPPFYLPHSHAHLADQETPLRAKHFAAAYALFRVSSMKNIQMALPPVFRDLWKGEFAQLKKVDEDAGFGWRYEADPFAAETKRQEIKADMEKRREEKAKADAISQQSSGGYPATRGGLSAANKFWQLALKVDLGQKTRMEIEDLVRNESTWNPYAIQIPVADQESILSDLKTLGFRTSHIQEAMQYCKDKEEALEWLLVHVPEDDLPPWTFPPGYTTGISLATTNLEKAAKITRLSWGGFSMDECAKALRAHDDNELLAAQTLQDSVVLITIEQAGDEQAEVSDDGIWQEEMASLEATFADKFSATTPSACSVSAKTTSDQDFKIHFRMPARGYPMTAVPIVAIQAGKVPAYVRLSAMKQLVLHARQTCLGYMMIWSMVEWLETNLEAVIENPGPLRELHVTESVLEPKKSDIIGATATTKVAYRGGRSCKTGGSSENMNKQLLEQLEARHKLPQQIKMVEVRQKLPAWSKCDKLIDAVSAYQCVIVTGETGSGKSTQSVQFVLDHLIRTMHGSIVNILCTQPRRISALGLSDRVSSERCTSVGDEVGYIIRGEAKVSSRTKITFMTTGVLLRRMQSATSLVEALSDVSHVFIDEVHERNLDTDFALALLRDALRIRKDLKLVLMSATLDASIFSDYFGGSNLVGRVHIEGRTFPIHDYYLDEILRTLSNEGAPANCDWEETTDLGSGSALHTHDQLINDTNIGKSIRELGMGINYDMIARLVRHIDHRLGSQPGGILIFLPGTFEIDRCVRALDLPGITALPLHASLTPSEQRRVFLPTKYRKVVVATNVAETSITIEDIVAVIDTGRVKETKYDTENNIVRLQEVWASRAACKQRRGRAGRVRDGICYKLFTRSLEASMADRPEPEIRRVPLEQLCLSVKATGADRDVAEFLSATLTPPDSAAISNALRLLHRMNALDNGRLTALGSYMSMIPTDLRCAKLLIYGCIFSCLEPCLTIAAILASRSPFLSPRDKREEAKEARLAFSSSHGDLLLDVAAFDACSRIGKERGYRELRHWCEDNFISQNTIRDISSARTQLLDSLRDARLVHMSYRNRECEEDKLVNTNSHNHLFLRALIAGSLNPQTARIHFPDKKFIASMTGATEIDPEARTIRYFNEENGRVFVHPSSALFDAQSYSSNAAFVCYFTKMATSKTFIRDLTRDYIPCAPISEIIAANFLPAFNAYALLLFGGPIELDTSGQGISVDGWLRLRGWARIGVLVSRLRVLLDDALRKSIDTPGTSLTGGDNGLFRIVRRLVELNGQDQ